MTMVTVIIRRRLEDTDRGVTVVFEYSITDTIVTVVVSMVMEVDVVLSSVGEGAESDGLVVRHS